MKHMLKIYAAALALASGSAAFAQDAESALASKDCKKEVKTYCTGLAPGSGQIQSCLAANADKLGAVCKAALAKSDPAAMPAESRTPAAEPKATPPQ